MWPLCHFPDFGSVLTYGHEAWIMTDKLVNKLRSWNARSLHFITGRDHKSEYREPSVDIMADMRMCRLRWLGHILRLPNGRLIKQWVQQEWTWQAKLKGSIFEDAPPHDSIASLEEFAHDREAWNRRVNAIATKTN